MQFSDVIRETKANFLAGNAVIWKGDPGGGKTYQSKMLFKWLKSEGEKKGERWGLSRVFMATQTPTDFTGLPWKGERKVKMSNGETVTFTVTDPAMPMWYLCEPEADGLRYPACCYDHVFLVIEEWGQGELDSKKAGANLLLERGTPPFFLPSGSHVLALSNTDSRDGITKEFDFVIRRRVEYEVSASAKGWLNDFAEHPYEHEGKIWKVSDDTKAWAASNEAVLYEPKPKQQGPWCNPSTATAMDRYKQIVTNQNNGVTPVDDPCFMQSLSGTMGMPATQSYINTLRAKIELPKHGDIVKDPLGTPVPKRPDLLMLLCYQLASNTEPNELGPVIQYMSRKDMAKDMQVTFVTSLLRRDYDTFHDLPAMQGWINKNAALVGIVASLSR